jgi:pimeloyl-ACP methyl ester carboxylesterase
MGEPVTRRWQAQRWLVDNVIRAVGMDFDQNRTGYLAAPCGPEAAGDFQMIRQRIQKFSDFAPAFEAAARRREERARAAEGQGRVVSAREDYFTAAIHWAAAQWPIAENNETNLFYNQRKVECYARYAHLADHHVERVLIPFHDKALPAWFHLPPGYQGGRLPTVLAIPGMDSFKETAVLVYGDALLNRGCAVLALDGPGQYESPVLGVYVTMQNWIDAARIVFDWLAARSEVDPERVGVMGNSFGSLFGTVVAGAEPRYRACAVRGPIHEPGCHTIFEEASPTFKLRFMYMAGYEDEDQFDAFARTLTWEGWAERVRGPYLCVAGEADELSPLIYTERLFDALSVPKQLVVYQDARHSVGGSPSVLLGPAPRTLMADWMVARLAGQPLESERWYVESSGRIVRSPL